jgi:hypothetical protein
VLGNMELSGFAFALLCFWSSAFSFLAPVLNFLSFTELFLPIFEPFFSCSVVFSSLLLERAAVFGMNFCLDSASLLCSLYPAFFPNTGDGGMLRNETHDNE